MKIVSIRNQFLEKEVRKLGHEVLSFGFGRRGRYDSKMLNKFVRFVAENKPDFLWFLKDPHITPKALNRIKTICPKTKLIMWYGDQRGYVIPPLIAQRREFLDGLFVTNSDQQQISMYKNAINSNHVYTFYHSFSTEEFQEWPRKITHGVFFGGSNFNITKFPMCKLRRNFIARVHRNFKLVVHGGGWPFKTEKWLQRHHYAKELRKAHINLGINHFDMERYYNRRLFECVASGRLHITFYIPGMERHFKNKKHLVWFKNIKNGLALIDYYLKNSEEREEIAANGRQFFIKNHSWPVRAKQLIKLFSKF
jgi:hypothetical protein